MMAFEQAHHSHTDQSEYERGYDNSAGKILFFHRIPPDWF